MESEETGTSRKGAKCSTQTETLGSERFQCNLRKFDFFAALRFCVMI